MTGVPCAICLLMWSYMDIVEGACDVCLMSVCRRWGGGGGPVYWCV